MAHGERINPVRYPPFPQGDEPPHPAGGFSGGLPLPYPSPLGYVHAPGHRHCGMPGIVLETHGYGISRLGVGELCFRPLELLTAGIFIFTRICSHFGLAGGPGREINL